ncbi:MAG: rhamnulokinase [Oscillospiraceae bacterium]|jgi:rhamnulokinase|nr:rhamnulokinase [Oscillospiraceae bacterium]
MDSTAHLAIDIGASGGRHILGWLEDEKLRTEEIYRFPNAMVQYGKQLCWDIDLLYEQIITGLKKCALLGKIPASVGIDTWGVDFVLLDSNGELLGPAVAYRDNRTVGMDTQVNKFICESELYARAGIQKMLLNTIYQLMAVSLKTPKLLEDASSMLFLPDYLHYTLCGVMKTEYTIASTSSLLNARAKTWDEEIIARCGFKREIFGEIVPAGTILGRFTDQVRQAVGFDCKVIMPPSHDTASAFLAVPAKSERSVYISSGTWSLMGVELSEPITTQAAREANFTNEGGYDYRYRYLKNIAGLWLIQSVHKEIGNDISYDDLVALARNSDCDSVFDVNDERFSVPESMVSAITDVCREYGLTAPQDLGDFASSIFHSLAASYSLTMKSLQDLTGTLFDSINIIGGGSQNEYLNKLTADACGLPVYAGPVEASALGNIASQMIALGVLSDLSHARRVIRKEH